MESNNSPIDVLDPKFYASWEHLEALVEGLELQNNCGPRPAGGQQCGMDKSWDLPQNRNAMRREIAWYCRAMKEAIKGIKSAQKD